MYQQTAKQNYYKSTNNTHILRIWGKWWFYFSLPAQERLTMSPYDTQIRTVTQFSVYLLSRSGHFWGLVRGCVSFSSSPLSFPSTLSSPDWAPWRRVGWERGIPRFLGCDPLWVVSLLVQLLVLDLPTSSGVRVLPGMSGRQWGILPNLSKRRGWW